MRIMIDTNVLISAILFPNSKLSMLIWDVTGKHELILCSHIIDEIHIVFERKFADKTLFLEDFLSELTYELIYTPKEFERKKYPDMRDPKDLPILVSAIIGNVDILITGDKDFQGIDIELPEVMTPLEYMAKQSDIG